MGLIGRVYPGKRMSMVGVAATHALMNGSHNGGYAMSTIEEYAGRVTRKRARRGHRCHDDHDLSLRQRRVASSEPDSQPCPKDRDLPDSAVLPPAREYVGPCTSKRYIWNASSPVQAERPIWQDDDGHQKDFFPEVHDRRSQRIGLPRMREYVGPCTSPRYIWNCDYPARLERPRWQS